MKKNYIARRRGTSLAAAALSFALVAPFAQPVAFAAPGDVSPVDAQPVDSDAAGQPADEQPGGEQPVAPEGEVIGDLFPSREGQQLVEADADLV